MPRLRDLDLMNGDVVLSNDPEESDFGHYYRVEDLSDSLCRLRPVFSKDGPLSYDSLDEIEWSTSTTGFRKVRPVEIREIYENFVDSWKNLKTLFDTIPRGNSK